MPRLDEDMLATLEATKLHKDCACANALVFSVYQLAFKFC